MDPLAPGCVGLGHVDTPTLPRAIGYLLARFYFLPCGAVTPLSQLTSIRPHPFEGTGRKQSKQKQSPHGIFFKNRVIQFVRIEPALPGSIRNFEENGVFTEILRLLWLSASCSGAKAPVLVARPDEFTVTSHYSNIETCMDRPSSVVRAIRGVQ